MHIGFQPHYPPLPRPGRAGGTDKKRPTAAAGTRPRGAPTSATRRAVIT